MLYVFAQVPVARDGLIVPVEAGDVSDAVRQAEATLGSSMYRQLDDVYSDGFRTFQLFIGEEGVEGLIALMGEATLDDSVSFGRLTVDLGLPVVDPFAKSMNSIPVGGFENQIGIKMDSSRFAVKCECGIGYYAHKSDVEPLMCVCGRIVYDPRDPLADPALNPETDA